jgi:hypothetical protein
MKIISNTKLIQRNKKIGQILTLTSLVVLGIGLYISFNPETLNLSLIALIIGFLLSQIGIYFGNRWGRSPRPDEHLDGALKGLDDRYTLYHYTSPVTHLLVGPAGVWALLPIHQRGKITYEKGRFRQKGGGLGLLYLKVFAQESLGRPDIEAKAELDEVQKFLDKTLGELPKPPVQVALVFTNPQADVQAPDAPYPALDLEKLKEYIRKRVKENSKSTAPESLKLITSALPSEEETA